MTPTDSIPAFAIEDIDRQRVVAWNWIWDPRDDAWWEFQPPMASVFWGSLRPGPPIGGRTDHALDVWSPRTPIECTTQLDLLVQWVPTAATEPCTEIRVQADDGRSWEPGCLRSGRIQVTAEGSNGEPAHLRLEPLAPEVMTKLRTAATATVECGPVDLVPGEACDGGMEGSFDGRTCFRGSLDQAQDVPRTFDVPPLSVRSTCDGDAELSESWTIDGEWSRLTWAPKGPGVVRDRIHTLGWETGRVAASPYCCGGVVVPRGTPERWGESTFDHGCPSWPDTATPAPVHVRRAVRFEKHGER